MKYVVRNGQVVEKDSYQPPRAPLPSIFAPEPRSEPSEPPRARCAHLHTRKLGSEGFWHCVDCGIRV